MTATLRPVTRADLPSFHAVMMAAGMDSRSSWNRTTVADLEHSLFGHGAGGFVALGDRGEVLGCVGYRPDGPQTLTLNKLATLPQARGRGIGAALVRAVEDLAAERGFGRLLLAVSQFNLEVIPFYERLGYTQDSAAVYAHASPQSPKPVVLVKKVERLFNETALSLENIDWLRSRLRRGERFQDMASLIREKEFRPFNLILLWKEAFHLPLPCAIDAMDYTLNPSPEKLERLSEYPEWNELFGATL